MLNSPFFAEGTALPANAALVLRRIADNSSPRTALPVTSSGAFRFPNVEDGSYTLDVEASGFLFPSVSSCKGLGLCCWFSGLIISMLQHALSDLQCQVKLIIKGGNVKAILADFAGSPELPQPLKIAPISRLHYYEQRQGFNIMSWLKTPYGMMVGFMIFSMVIMPLLKVDPEEYAQMQEEKKKLTERFSGNGNDSRGRLARN